MKWTYQTKLHEARRSDTSFNGSKIIINSSFERNVKDAADNICSPNRFELPNCEIMESDENDQPYDEDTSIVGSDTMSHYSECEQQKRSGVVVNKFLEKQHNFQKKCARGKNVSRSFSVKSFKIKLGSKKYTTIFNSSTNPLHLFY